MLHSGKIRVSRHVLRCLEVLPFVDGFSLQLLTGEVDAVISSWV